MRCTIIAMVAIILFSCEEPAKKMEDYSPAEQARIREISDSIIKKATIESLFDTVGLHSAPVKILSARLITKEYSNYRDIRLAFKNVSSKTISAIRFKWYGLDAFGEPADMGSYMTEGFGGGFTDDPLKPGRSDNGTWSIMSKDAKKIVLAWPYEVAFSDGSKWEIGKN